MEKTFVCKTASIDDVARMVNWAKKEGWNPGLHDHVPFHVVDPTGFFMGYLDDEPIASISAVRYEKQFAFMGFYIMQPEYRGQGLALKLWQHAIDYLAGYNIGLDGVIDQQDNYKKSGFKLAHRNIRFSGKISNIKPSFLMSARSLAFNSLSKYDEKFFSAPRSAFLAAWLAMPEGQALAMIQDSDLVGYGAVRRCYEGYKIGPLFADNYKIAEQLFLGLCQHAQQEIIFLDIPEINKDGLKLAEEYNLKPVFETARMYTQAVPQIDMKKVYGITSFELG